MAAPAAHLFTKRLIRDAGYFQLYFFMSPFALGYMTDPERGKALSFKAHPNIIRQGGEIGHSRSPASCQIAAPDDRIGIISGDHMVSGSGIQGDDEIVTLDPN